MLGPAPRRLRDRLGARSFLLLAISISLVAPRSGSAQIAPEISRLNLLASDGDYLYWGADADDPELDVGTLRWRCLWYPPSPKPCRVGSTDEGLFGYTLAFLPATLLTEPVSLSPTAPLRFRLALEVDTPLEYGVHLQLVNGSVGAIHTSEAATEVSPGIWEGTLPAAGPLDSRAGNSFVIFIATLAQVADVTLHTRGASYVELPEPVGALSVPALVAQDTYAVEPQAVETEFRSFRFNDDRWDLFSFEGSLSETRSFDLDLPGSAAAVFAFLDLYDEPFTYAAARERRLEPEQLTPSFRLRLLRDGVFITDGFSNGESGYGTDSLAHLDVAAGPLTLEVQRAREVPDSEATYTVHLLALYGARTLDSYRVRFAPPARDVTPAGRAPGGAAICPPGTGVVPLTAAVTSVGVDLDWDTIDPAQPSKWTPKFEVPGLGEFPCGDLGNGDRVRITVPGPRLTYFGAVPAHDTPFVSYRDTVIEAEVSFAYSPPA